MSRMVYQPKWSSECKPEPPIKKKKVKVFYFVTIKSVMESHHSQQTTDDIDVQMGLHALGLS